MELFRGYIVTNGKASMQKFKDVDLMTLEQVRDADSYAGVLGSQTILIDIDDGEQAETLMDIVEEKQLNCLVLQTSRGKHFYFKNTGINNNGIHKRLACGLVADIKCGSKASYGVLKKDGEERFVEWEPEVEGEFDELPRWLEPVSGAKDFNDLAEGDGRNQSLFTYILTLQSEGYTKEETRETIRVINDFVLKEPLDQNELETILRDDAFSQEVFFKKNVFLFDKFAQFLCTQSNIIKIHGQLHVYKDGVYVPGKGEIESAMISYIPNLKKAQRTEVMEYLQLIVRENTEVADARYIPFKNGIYDIVEDELLPFSPDIVVTNKTPYDYKPGVYDELMDITLDKMACKDSQIRAVMEECAGYCLYRRNELGKAFILTGEKANGKSTFLDLVKKMLGEENISALDLNEMAERFSTAMMFGKLANIGDDIGDEFLMGKHVSNFKKIVTGNRIKAEFKGQDGFEFEPYTKLLFAANTIPRMRDQTGAVLRRLVIIPFNAKFTKEDPDYDPYIKYKLIEPGPMEYFISIAVAGLRRVLENNQFTQSAAIDEQVREYELQTNPVVGFINLLEESDVVNKSSKGIYSKYQGWCYETGGKPMSKSYIDNAVKRHFGLEIEKKVDDYYFTRSRG